MEEGEESLFKKIEGEFFIDQAKTKLSLKDINQIDISEISIVLISTFDDLFGLPFLIKKNNNF
jgi:hypothetical protein